MPSSEELKGMGTGGQAGDRPYDSGAEREMKQRGLTGLGKSQALRGATPPATSPSARSASAPSSGAPSPGNTASPSDLSVPGATQQDSGHANQWALDQWTHLAGLPGASPFTKEMALRMKEYIDSGNKQQQ